MLPDEFAGASYVDTPTNSVATVWNGMIPSALPAVPGASTSSAFAINNFGRVVGVSNSGASSIATVWNANIPTALNLPANTTGSTALDVNDVGRVVG
ncbi:hypothetical protein GCM10010987_00110 [Bradyrhizobium guangdongense]|uniref:Uncharacterized protein n=1 Tax=Bradyrhizobium guangdongense TaxID=1325090 RepID=A0AA87W228_9BRAD|nr:hypothetical protein GCM10010987_00110 [Bradyrhizobium guangdongense]